MASRLFSIPKAYPLAFGAAFSTVKTTGVDLAVQLKLENKEWKDVDWSRNAAFGLFGLFYLGGVQYFLYVPFFGRLFPNAATFAAKSIPEKLKDAKGIRDMCAQVFLDQCVHHPILYFPVFYSLQSAMKGQPVSEGLSMYKENMMEDMVALWKVWVPATVFNFTFSPMYLRIPVVATTSLVWTAILSAMRGGDGKPLGAEEAAAVIGNQGALIQEYFEAPPLDPSLEHSIVLAHGPHRLGLVPLISSTITDKAKGSISESKMVKMGHYYTIMMLVSTPPGGKRLLEEHLVNPLSEVGQLMDVTLADVTEKRAEDARGTLERRVSAAQRHPHQSVAFNFKVEGPDRPGIVKEVTSVLASHQVNCNRLESNTKAVQGSGSPNESATSQPIFVLIGDAQTSPNTDLEQLAQDMDGLALRMGVAYSTNLSNVVK